MPNPFYIEPVNPLAALMSGQQGYDQGQKRLASNAIEAAAPALAAGDYKAALAQIMSGGGGNLQAGLAVQGLANNERDYQLHKQTAESNIAHQRAQDKHLENPDLHFETVTPNPLDPSSTRIVGFSKKNGQMIGSYPITGGQAPPQAAPAAAAPAAPQAAFSPANPTPSSRVAQGFQDVGAQPATASQVSPYNDAVLANQPAGVQTLIRGLAGYDLDPNSLSTRPNKMGVSPRDEAIRLTKQYSPEYEQANFANRKRTEGSFNVGVEGRVTRAVGNLTEHLSTAEELAKALNNGDNQLYNSIKNKFGTLFGATAPTNAAIAAPIIGGEMTKVIAGASGGGVTERLENALNALGQAKTWPQLQEGLQTVRRLMVGQIHGLENQYIAGTYYGPEKGKERYRTRLTPGARKMLDAEEARVAAPPGSEGGAPKNEKPARVKQGAYIYELQPDGSYKPVQ